MAESKKKTEPEQSATGAISRRNMFPILGATPAIAAIAAASAPAQTPAGQSRKDRAYKPKIFDERQWRQVHVLCDLIIPADERSGNATQAGVPEFIDDWLDFRNREDGNQNFTAQILGGLAWLNRESSNLFHEDFADASPDQQKQLLDQVAWPARAQRKDSQWVVFFNKFRDLTVSGFFSSKMGVADLPYLGNRAVAEWKGCDPKIWAIIEERMNKGYIGLGGKVEPWTA